MSDLVQRLSEGTHRVEVSLRPEKTVKAFKDGLDRGYLHIRFLETRGGTELGVRVDHGLTDLTGANFDLESGRATVVGTLTLDYVSVRCTADIELPKLFGSGRLERLTT